MEKKTEKKLTKEERGERNPERFCYTSTMGLRKLGVAVDRKEENKQKEE